MNKTSGLCEFIKKTNIVGLAWWKYIAVALRIQKSSVILGGGFMVDKIVLIYRLARICENVNLTGELGVRLWMANRNIRKFCDLENNENQDNFLKKVLEYFKS